jgi:gliding motility-associated lipoprotein GldD
MARKHKKQFITAILVMLPVWIITISLSLLFCECSNNNNEATTNNSDEVIIPRRKAFPRINTHDSTFVAIKNTPVHFEISKAASITLDSTKTDLDIPSQWINIYYKPYKATIHCTFTQVDSTTINQVIDNRSERMSLNIGSLTTELIELTNANNFYSQILTTEQCEVTPIQFLSTDDCNWVVSGALYFEQTNNVDSIRPVIDVIKRDIIHSLKTINKQ